VVVGGVCAAEWWERGVAGITVVRGRKEGVVALGF